MVYCIVGMERAGNSLLVLFIPEIRYFLPTLSKIMCDHLRTAVSGEDALAVAVGTHAALYGGKIGKVPDLFADKEGASVKGFAVHLIEFHLELFAEHLRNAVMKPRQSVGTVF